MSSICMERRERNHVAKDTRRIEMTRRMIGNPMARGAQTFKNDHGWRKCQAFQLFLVFGTHSILFLFLPSHLVPMVCFLLIERKREIQSIRRVSSEFPNSTMEEEDACSHTLSWPVDSRGAGA